MTFNFTKEAEYVGDYMDPTFKAQLMKITRPVSDTTYQAMKHVLTVGAITTCIKAYRGGDGFLHNLGKQITEGRILSDKQCRSAVNIFIGFCQPDEAAHKAWKEAVFALKSAPSPATPAPVQAATHAYQCFTCRVTYPTMKELMDHKRAAHPSVATNTVTAPAVPIKPLFTPKLGLNLVNVPDGRFAIIVDGRWVYVIKRTTRRPYTRTGRYVWGQQTRQSERVPRGTIELRIQRGDTKELVGEQKPGSAIYYGEQEEIVQQMMQDPATAATFYGILEAHCGYCGKSLTDDESKLRGIGPDCWENKHIVVKAGRWTYARTMKEPDPEVEVTP